MSIVHVREIEAREQRIIQLEGVIDHQANIISSLADTVASLRIQLERPRER